MGNNWQLLISGVGALGGLAAILSMVAGRIPTRMQRSDWRDREIVSQRKQIDDLSGRVATLELLHTQAVASLGQMTLERDQALRERDQALRTLEIFLPTKSAAAPPL